MMIMRSMRRVVCGAIDSSGVTSSSCLSPRDVISKTQLKTSAGRNPIAMLLTTELMLEWLKETEMATRLETAIARVIAEGKMRTYDMGGKDSTLDVAKAIADYASS